MTLRNAFAGLVTESVTGAIEAILARIETKQAEAAAAQADASQAALDAHVEAATAQAEAAALDAQRSAAIAERMARERLHPMQALPYAKTVSDTLRVNIDNAPQAVVYPANSSSTIQGAVIVPTLFGNNATFTVDEREQQRLQSEANYNVVRQRWSL